MKLINTIFLILVLSFSVLNAYEHEADSIKFKEPKLKSLGAAYLLATGSTLIPMLGFPIAPPIGFSGIIIGPSVGQFYAGSVIQGSIGIILRGAGVLLAADGFGTLLYFGDNSPKDSNAGYKLIGGAIIFIGSFIYSFIDTHSSVITANENIKENKYKIIPTLLIKENNTISGNIQILF